MKFLNIIKYKKDLCKYKKTNAIPKSIPKIHIHNTDNEYRNNLSKILQDWNVI